MHCVVIFIFLVHIFSKDAANFFSYETGIFSFAIILSTLPTEFLCYFNERFLLTSSAPHILFVNSKQRHNLIEIYILIK